MGWLIYGALAYVVYKAVTQAKSGDKPAARPPSPARRRSSEPAAPAPHEVLGVARGATEDEIRKAYQAKIKQYHPDRVSHAADELQLLAERRTKEINAAYHALMKDR
jgi:DnaJ like chaperone protein